MRNVIYYWLGRMSARIVSFLLLPVYTAYIVPKDWGIFNLLMVSGDMAVILLSCQLPSALYRFWAFSQSEGEQRRLTGLVVTAPIILSAFVCVPFYIWSDKCAEMMGISGYGNYVRVQLAITQLSLVLNVIQAEMRLRDDSKLYAVLDVGQNLALAGVNIFFVVVMGWGIRGIFVGHLLIFAIVVCLLVPRFLRHITLNLDLSVLRNLFKFSLPLVPSALAMAAIHNIDRYFLQFFLGPTEVGLYCIGYKFGFIVSIIVFGPFLLIWEPKSYEFAKAHDAAVKYGEVLSYLLAFAVFVALGLTGTAKEIVQIMTSPQYFDSYSVIPFVCWSYVIFSIDAVAKMGLLVHHRTKTMAVIALSVCSVNVIGNIILIPKMGMKGAACATLIAFILLFCLDFFLAKKFLPIAWQWNKLGKLAIISALVLGCMLSVRDLALWPAVLVKAAILAGYPILLYFFGFVTKKDLKSFIGRKFVSLKGA